MDAAIAFLFALVIGMLMERQIGKRELAELNAAHALELARMRAGAPPGFYLDKQA